MSCNYVGTFFQSMDAKNRIFIPSDFRSALGENFYIFKFFDGCLYLYDNESWQQTYDSAAGTTDTEDGRRKIDALFMRVSGGKMDKQGRVTLPAECVAYAGLEKDIVFFGTGNKIQIWSKEKWDEKNRQSDEDLLRSGIKF